MTLPKVKKMSTKPQISQELSESISQTLGKNVRILYKSLIRMESRGEKVDNRVLVITSFRVFITTNKVPTRIDNGFHLMEIEAIESKKPNNLCITLVNEHKPVSILVGEDGASEGVINVMSALVGAFDDLFPNIPIEDIVNKVNLPFPLQTPSGTRKHSTCGDFSNQYAAMCDLCQTPFRAEVAWDVETIYLAHDIRMLHLKDFDHLEQRELVPLLLSAQHSAWWRGVAGDGVRAPDALDTAARLLRAAAPPLTRLSWVGGGLRAEQATRLGHALLRARRTPRLHTLDLSHNQIEDRGAISILTGLANNPDGLRHLALSQCGISGKTVTQLATILTDNPVHLTTLTHLDLSNNNLKDDVHNLYNFLAQPNVITHLNLSNTETPIENLWGALLRGCAARLSALQLARNPWAAQRKARDPPPSFRHFFTACLALTDLDFSYCKLPPDVLKALLLGLACNESGGGGGGAGGGGVRLSLCGVLSAAQAHVLESCVHGVRCLTALDLSDNNMEYEMAGIVRAIGKNPSITELSLSRLTGKRAYAPPLIQALVYILQEPDTSILNLDLSDCRFKSDLYGLLNALGGARRLRTLDISGNVAGDPGARLLAKALQCNCTLQTLYIDRNSFSLQGLSEVAGGVRRSVSLRRVEFPAADAAAGPRHALDKLAALWRQLHDKLSENSSTSMCPTGRLRALALERAWSGAESGAALAAAAAAALPPPPAAAAAQRAAAAAHRLIHQYLERCSEVFAAMGGPAPSNSELISLQAVKDAMAPCTDALQDLVTEAVESMALAACAAADRPPRDMPDLLPPASHTAATPLGARRREVAPSRRVRPKSVAEQARAGAEPLSLPPLPPLQPPPATPLRHLVKGRPKRTKTRAPTRPITDQQDNDEGLEEFWRACRSPADSEEPSLASRHNTLTSRSLQSVCSPPDDTMYSVTSGESTPILLEEEVSRCRSTDDVGTKATSTPPPSRSSDNVNSMAGAGSRGRPWSVAGDARCTTEGVEGCVGGSIVGITPGAALTSSMLRDHPITPEETAET